MKRLEIFEFAMMLSLAFLLSLTGMYVAIVIAMEMYELSARQLFFSENPIALPIIAVQLILMVAWVFRFCINSVLQVVRDEFNNKDIDS
jgi:hypothetical protein